MKVLQINSFFSVGGPPRIMNGIYTTLKENGYDCKIAAAREKIIWPNDSIVIESSNRVLLNALESRLLDNDGFLTKKNTKKLVHKIEEYDPDIIQLHNLHGYYLNVEILFDYLKKSGKPVVWTLHDCWAITGHCPYFTAANCSKYVKGCFRCPLKKRYPSSYMLDQSKRNWKRKREAFSNVPDMLIVTPSIWLAEIIHNSFLNNYPVKVINNGIDLESFSFKSGRLLERYSLQKKKIVLGVAQNWAENKGFEDFVKLSGRLGSDYQVVMIGLTDKQLSAIPKTVIGIKRTNSVEELAEWYSNAQVFVNLTYQDNFPTVNIEALACGTPIITYDTGGSPEAIDETCGWVVEQGNMEKVVDIIQSMGKREAYQDKALVRSKLFDRKTKYMEYIDIYKDTIIK